VFNSSIRTFEENSLCSMATSSDGYYTSIDGYTTSIFYRPKANQISPWYFILATFMFAFNHERMLLFPSIGDV
jgi:hypothetical protein